MTGEMKEYLVKSSSKVIGPYNEDEIIDLLLSNQISLLDEIKKPYGRWIYLREDKHFRDVVDRVRSQIDQLKEDTEGSTQTGTHTKRISDELTPTPLPRQVPVISTEEEVIAPPQPKRVEKIKEIRNATEKVKTPDYKQVSSSATARKSQVRSFVLTAMLVGAVAVLFIFHSRKGGVNENPQARFFRALALKQNQIALSSYNAMNTQDRMSVKVKKAILPIIANFDKGNSEVRDALLQLIQSVDDRKEKSIFANSVGISYMHEQKWDEAYRYFDSAIKYDAYNPAPLINMATLKVLSGQFLQAMDQYRQLLLSNSYISGGSHSNTLYKTFVQYGFVYSFFKEFARHDLAVRKKIYSDFRGTLSNIDRSLDKQYYLNFEISYLQFLIQLEFVQDDIEENFQKFFRTALNDPSLVYKSPDLYWDFVEWKSIRDLCNQTSLKSLQVSLFKTMCQLRSNQEAEAERGIKEDILQFPKEKDAMLTYAFYLMKVGKYDEAKAQTDVVLRMGSQNHLAQWLQGSICVEASRDQCATNMLREVLKAGRGNIANWVDLFALDGEKVKYEFPLENLNPIDRQTYLPYIELVMKESKE